MQNHRGRAPSATTPPDRPASIELLAAVRDALDAPVSELGARLPLIRACLRTALDTPASVRQEEWQFIASLLPGSARGLSMEEADAQIEKISAQVDALAEQCRSTR